MAIKPEAIITKCSILDVAAVLDLPLETVEIINEFFNSLLTKYQVGLEESIKGSEFVFDSVDLLHYKYHKTSLIRGGLYTGSLKWLKNKKTTINSKNNDGKCFEYAATAALDHQNIKYNPEKIRKIIPLLINIIGKK